MRRRKNVRPSLVLLLLLGAACVASPARPRTGAFGRVPAPAEAYAEYLRGRHASYQGEHAAAVRHFRRAQQLTPDDPSLPVAIAEELIADGNLDAAEAELAAVLQRWPGHADAWVARGRLAARRGDKRGAALAYDQAVALGPDAPSAYFLAGAAHERLGDHQGARAVYADLVRRWPDDADAHFRLARATAAAGDPAAAARSYTRAIELAPDHIDARVALARLHLAAGRRDEATATLRAAYDRSGEDPWVAEQLYRALLAAGDRDAAVALLADLDGDFRSPAARLGLAELYLAARRPDDTLRITSALLAADPGAHAARLAAARAHAQKRDRAAALAAAAAIPAGAAEYAEARAFMADQLHKDGRPAEARTVVDEALAAAPDAVPLTIALALVHERAGRVDEARAVLAAAHARRPGDTDLVFARCSLEERSGDPERGVELMRREVLAEDPDSVMALNFIGYSYANRGVRLAEAEKLLARALELAPDDGLVLDSWGWLLFRLGRTDEALEALERADRMVPDEPEILLHLAEARAHRGDKPGAAALLDRALALDAEDHVRRALEARRRQL